jgi:Xaa-Pro aminopeptidase
LEWFESTPRYSLNLIISIEKAIPMTNLKNGGADSNELPFTPAEYSTRWEAVYHEMRRRNLNAAVAWSRGGGSFDRFQEVFYLTNYYSCNSGCAYDWMQKGTRAASQCAVILQLDREPILISDDPTVDPRGVATDQIVTDTDVVAALARTLNSEQIVGLVGFIGMDCISATHMYALNSLAPQIEWVEQDDLIVDVRIIKSEAEQEMFRKAGITVSAALDAMFEVIHSGGSEADAAAAAASEVYRRQGNINFCHLAHGPWMGERLTDTPLAGYSQRTPANGELVRGWVYGAMHKGYWLDPGRTTVVGLRPTSDQKHLIESCAGIVERLRAEIRPGVLVKDIAKLGQRLKEEFNGRGPEEDGWFSIFGHGNGLYFEPPVLSTSYEGKHQIFREGMVAATEAFLDLPGVGSAGFEQNFIITANGTELLTTSPLVWW